MDISTRYLGMELKNPVLVGAGPLTMTAKGVEGCAKAGAGAVVLNSLFEEQLRHDTADTRTAIEQQALGHSEAYEYLDADIEMQYASRDYLRLIQDCKAAVDIPVIASVNCSSATFWQEFSSQIQLAGADALEMNIAIYPDEVGRTAATIEDEYIEAVRVARSVVSIPIAVKLGPFFTSLPNMLCRLAAAGADGFVLFNRFYPPAIDIDAQAMTMGARRSSPVEVAGPLRAIGLCEGEVPGDFAASTGVHDGADLVRLLLAGASVAQVVTTLLENGRERLAEMLTFLQTWMRQHGYASVDEFRGKLAEVRNPGAGFFSRLQYMAMYGRK